MGLKQSVVSGAIWTGLEKILTQLVHFVIGIVLARILSPGDYGVVGMLTIFIAIANVFTDSGLSSALIQKKNRNDTDYSTIFYFNLAVAVFFYCLLFFTSPLIADFYNMPILKDVTRVVALSLIITGFTAVQSTRLRINLQFRKLSVIAIASMLVTGGTGLFLAFNGFGVWALVIQTVAGNLFSSVCVWCVAKWRPSLVFSKESFKSLWGVGSKLLGSSLINSLYSNLYTLVIGKFFSKEQVGYYNRGNQYALLPMQSVQDMALKVNFPVLSKLQDDDERLIAAYKKLMTVPLYLLYPILVGLAVVAPYLIPIMIGEKWIPCVPVLQLLCIGYMLSPLTSLNLNLLYVKGRTDLVLKLEFFKKPIGFLILFLSIPLGLVGMVAGKAFYEFVAFSFNCYYTKKFYDYGEWKQLRALLPIVVNCVVMAFLVHVSMCFVDSYLIKLCVGIPVGIISYLILSIVCGDENYKELKSIVKGRLHKETDNVE